ncbi:MAG: hypothetical protein KatS3mg017_0390 [Fimbriimonadales bacterium]|nr:MAG: hypothetical protein KatS3mg017_0390 [Fimbriimonadales bacterium]
MNVHHLIRPRWLFIVGMSALMFGCQIILRLFSGNLTANLIAALGESAGYAFAFGLGWAFVLKGLDWMYGQEETEDQNDN